MDLTGYKFKSETFKRMLAEEVEKGVEAGVQAAVEKAVEVARADEAAKVEARAVLSVLAARNLPVTEVLRATILACTDLAVLERWIQRAATVSDAQGVVSD